MQARSGALDDLLASGALTDLTGSTDDIQAQLDKASATSDIDAQIAALKASGSTTALPSGTSDAPEATPAVETSTPEGS
jgi:phage shock protein A